MVYGLRFEDVSEVRKPDRIETNYGHYVNAINEPEFFLKKVQLNRWKENSFAYNNEVFLFVEEGSVILKANGKKEIGISMDTGSVMRTPANVPYSLLADRDCLVYLFSQGNLEELDLRHKVIGSDREFKLEKTFDLREKYWGRIESIVSEEIAGKRMFIKRGIIGSMEFHLRKKEAYYLDSGKLAVVLRAGEGEDDAVILNPGDAFVINPGLMHRRIALEDCVLFEISTKDDDRDSNIVESGKKYLDNPELRDSYLKKIALDSYFK